MALLTVSNLSTNFYSREGVTQAVKNVSFSLESGKVIGIVGESGSGKSVACYSLMGLIPCPPGKVESGSAVFDGKDLLKMSEDELRQIRGSRIGMIFQDPMTSLTPHMTVAEQLMEPLVIHKKMKNREAKLRAIEALKEVGIQDAEKRVDYYPHEFSGGMRQRVMIAMALINEPDLLIADEPTTALDVTVQAQILKLIKSLQEKRKLAVIFITHDLAVVSNMADHILVMCKGDVVEQGESHQVFHNPQHEYTKKLLAAVPDSAKQNPRTYSKDEPSLLEVKSLKKHFAVNSGFNFLAKKPPFVAVNDVSLDLKAGEILGLVGESGSGKSTLGRCIVRLLEANSGQVFIDGNNLLEANNKKLRTMRRDFQMIFQDPYASLNPRMTVFDTIAEPLKLHGLVNKQSISEAVNQLMDEVGLSRTAIRKYPHEFSGGQRQRIAIARALACKPKLIIADEPVSALDVTIQAQILELLLNLSQKHNLTMLFISHDLAVVRYLSDRVAVMKSGEIVEMGLTEDVYNNPQHTYTQSLLASIQKLA